MNGPRQHHHENGVILVLFALLIGVIALFVAYVVDLGRIFSTANEKTQTADLLALGALQAYIGASTDPAVTTHAARFTPAVNRAESIAAKNQATFEYRKQALSGGLADGSAGTVESGRWWTYRPDTCAISGCPCNLSTTINLNDINASRGCFQPCLSNGCPTVEVAASTARVLANAIRVTLKTTGGGLRNIFMPATQSGISRQQVEKRSSAAIRGGHGVFLVDLSRGMASESHPMFRRTCNPPPDTNTPRSTEPEAIAREPSFEISVTGPACGANHWNPCRTSSDCQIIEENPVYPRYAQPEACFDLRSDPYRALYLQVLNRGQVDHYKCFDFGGKRYLVDTITPPQPFTRLMSALAGALDYADEAGSGIEALSVMGFLHSNTGERSTPAGQYITPYGHQLTTVKGAGWGTRLDALRAIATDRIVAAENGFFIRPFARVNLTGGIAASRIDLKNNVYFYNKANFIALFSNGLANCSWHTCYETYEANLTVMNELLGFIPAVQQDEIRLHSIFSGAELLPHSTVVKMPGSNPPRCMNSEEKRIGGYLEAFALEEERTPAEDGSRLLAVGRYSPAQALGYTLPMRTLSAASRVLGGQWIPIRASCGDLCSGPDSLCAGAADPPVSISNPTLTRLHTVRVGRVDHVGRLSCDPYCRTEREQGREAFRWAMIADPPIQLVQ